MARAYTPPVNTTLTYDCVIRNTHLSADAERMPYKPNTCTHSRNFQKKLTTKKNLNTHDKYGVPKKSDLTQDTTLKALTNEKKYATNINFKGWVFTIMRNIFINGYRRKARSGVISEIADAPARIDLAQDSSAESPEDVYGAKEITQAINNFPEEYRRPFAMHIAGYKYSEIAEKTGLPLGTVKSRIYATRKRLQKQLSDYK